jgi:hypothetical protein
LVNFQQFVQIINLNNFGKNVKINWSTIWMVFLSFYNFLNIVCLNLFCPLGQNVDHPWPKAWSMFVKFLGAIPILSFLLKTSGMFLKISFIVSLQSWAKNGAPKLQLMTLNAKCYNWETKCLKKWSFNVKQNIS